MNDERGTFRRLEAFRVPCLGFLGSSSKFQVSRFKFLVSRLWQRWRSLRICESGKWQGSCVRR